MQTFWSYVARYWQSNMNNVKANKSAHKESVRDLRYELIVCLIPNYAINESYELDMCFFWQFL